MATLVASATKEARIFQGDSVAPLGYIPSLDGVRACAVLCVIFYHLRWQFENTPFAPLLHCGWIGVDIFFALSGFLITRILLSERGKQHYFLSFYKRRAFRIWPLYYMLIVAAFALALYQGKASSISWWTYVTLTQNLFLATFGIEMLRMTWSLAIEEQFYALWPVLVRFIGKVWLVVIGLAFFTVAPVIRLIFLRSHEPQVMYLRTYTHFDGILLGSLLAIWFSSSRFRPRSAKACFWGSLIAGGVGTVLTISPTEAAAQTSPLLYTFLALGSTGLVGLCSLPDFSLAPLFSWTPLRYIGRISYGMYLLHIQTFEAIDRLTVHLRLPVLLLIPLKLVLVTVLASISWRFFESRIIFAGRRHSG